MRVASLWPHKHYPVPRTIAGDVFGMMVSLVNMAGTRKVKKRCLTRAVASVPRRSRVGQQQDQAVTLSPGALYAEDRAQRLQYGGYRS